LVGNKKFRFSTAKDQNNANSKPITASDIYHLIWGRTEGTVVSDTETQNHILPVALGGCTSAEIALSY
jgi:hypothetical protein